VNCVTFFQLFLADLLQTYVFRHRMTPCAFLQCTSNEMSPHKKKHLTYFNYVIKYPLSEIFAEFRCLQSLELKLCHFYDWRWSAIPTLEMCAIFSRYPSRLPFLIFSGRNFRLSEGSSVPREPRFDNFCFKFLWQ